MEYIFLMLQILFLLCTVFLPTGDNYLLGSKENYKIYLLIEIIIQGLCTITNIVILFIIKKIAVYILVLHVILMGLIKFGFSIRGKKIYFKELTDMIVGNNLLTKSPLEIRNYLLKKYEKVFFIEDIKKCLQNLND